MMKTLKLMQGTALAVLFFGASSATAQSLADIQLFPEPLVLQGQGSFFVGGRTVHTESAGWDDLADIFGESFEAGEVTVDQMYVQFQTPRETSHTPIVFMHGGLLSSKQWETTPDGRMGWFEYFTRQGFPTYMAEQTGRARSGFDGTLFNQVRDGTLPPDMQPKVLLGTSNMAWKQFRFGPDLGAAWPDVQFPMESIDEFAKQVIPDMIETQVPSLLAELINPETDNPTVANVAQLANDLDGAILIGHSQSAGFPTQAVLKGEGGIKGLIQLETGCFGNLTDDHVAALAEVPILVVVGDYMGDDPAAACADQMARINAAGGDMTFLSLPEIGLEGTTHMFMQGRKNIEVADILIDWINQHVEN